MDLFKLNDMPTSMTSGEAINGYESILWVERYRTPGEFKMTARLSSGLREFLPLGTVISHTGTLESMIVENHVISEEDNEDLILTISGRSFDSYLEQRVVGQNQIWGSATMKWTINQEGYLIDPDLTWWQVQQLILDHIHATFNFNAGDGIPNTDLDIAEELGGVGEMNARVIKRGNLLPRTHELMEIDDLGLKVRRPNVFPGTSSGLFTTWIIHGGIDRRSTVRFTAQTGDVTKADYLWSNKKLKNAAMVAGKFVDVMVYGTPSGYDRRVLFVDGSDIDKGYSAIPTGTDLTNIKERLSVRGQQALAAQKQIVLSSADVSENREYRFRIDYDVGDIVSLDGNFGVSLPMRVVEYAEIVDENGESGQPTLEVLET